MANKYQAKSPDFVDLGSVGIDFGEDEDSGGFEYHKLTDKQLKLCKECFEFFDKDHSGAIEKAELITVMRAVGLNPSKKDVEKMIKSVAEKGNESISWPVFQELLSSSWKSVKQSKLEMLASFHIFDINKDGYVDASELKKTLTSMGESLTEEEAEVLLRTADTNGDGKIDYKEFVNMICEF
ncbi:neo-calmodulin-like [Crassostrea angulata]|uniref:neo-calmodulin-like n=1 Tax=Magallana angulata TaxID=2784310 RepID=UPI0022B148CF|nr:neo-calmodulin-like [Crassostrea angulata]